MEAGFKAYAVLPAAGWGERMGIPTPKQYCSLQNRPLISYTLESLERIPWISLIVVTVSPDRRDDMVNLLTDYRHGEVEVASGGATRHRSIYSGIKALKQVCEPSDVVIIHDAVRPFVPPDILTSVAQAAKEHGAAGAVRPLVSTVIATDSDGFLDHSLERSQYRASEMPQAFRYDVITTAYEKSTEYDFDFGTECLHLAQKYTGTRVKLVDGPVELWKVTHKKDIYAAEGIIKEAKTVLVIGCKDKAMEASVHDAIRAKGMKVDTSSERNENPSHHDMVIFLDSANLIGDYLREQLEHSRCTRSVVFVLLTKGGISVEFLNNIRTDAAKASERNVCLNGVLTDSLPSLVKVGPTVASLVFDCNTLYSGQVFHL